MKTKQKAKVHILVVDMKFDMTLASDHKHLILWSDQEVYIADIKLNVVIFRTKLLGSLDLNLELNSVKLNRFCNKLYLAYNRNGRLVVGYISLQYLKIFKSKEISTQTISKRFFDLEEVALYKTMDNRIKHSHSEVSAHLKTVFTNLGYNRERHSTGESELTEDLKNAEDRAKQAQNDMLYRLLIALNLDDQIVSDLHKENMVLLEQNVYLERNVQKYVDQINYCSTELKKMRVKNKELKKNIDNFKKRKNDFLD